MKDSRNNNRQENKTQSTAWTASHDQSEAIRLIERAAGGDVEAFGELYNIYLDRIYRYVFHQVKDRMTAEDITEEVFIKAWKAIDSCKGKEQTFLPWLYSIAHNHVIDVFRSKKKEMSLKAETVAEVCDYRLEVETKLEHQQLLDVIAHLPHNQRQVIILKFIEGLDNHEIGEVMHRNQGAIRVLQMRALATLRQKVDRDR